jgi:hypothetical protein
MIPSYAFHLGWHFAASDSPTVSGWGIVAFPPFPPKVAKINKSVKEIGKIPQNSV